MGKYSSTGDKKYMKRLKPDLDSTLRCKKQEVYLAVEYVPILIIILILAVISMYYILIY
jgi:hypothetical protein